MTRFAERSAMPTNMEIWEQNADCQDERMGDESNWFHRTVIRPRTEELLAIEAGDLVLDIACGNGSFSQRMAEQGARVVAFDFSEIEQGFRSSWPFRSFYPCSLL